MCKHILKVSVAVCWRAICPGRRGHMQPVCPLPQQQVPGQCRTLGQQLPGALCGEGEALRQNRPPQWCVPVTIAIMRIRWLVHVTGMQHKILTKMYVLAIYIKKKKKLIF